jgi:hypothetical protein
VRGLYARVVARAPKKLTCVEAVAAVGEAVAVLEREAPSSAALVKLKDVQGRFSCAPARARKPGKPVPERCKTELSSCMRSARQVGPLRRKAASADCLRSFNRCRRS